MFKFTNFVSLLILSSCAAFAQDASALLAKAHAAFVANQANSRFWSWTSISTRSVLDKRGTALEDLPSVTLESPIRSDGKRCTAVIAWGDGIAPYLVDASADERCKIQDEHLRLLRIDMVLEPRPVKPRKSKDKHEIVLELRQNKELIDSEDPVKNCAASIEATVRLDPATFFPKEIELHVPNDHCERAETTDDNFNHYEGEVVQQVMHGQIKGTELSYQYELQKDKFGDSKKDYWIITQARATRPIRDGVASVIVEGRRLAFKNTDEEKRKILVETKTTATELSAESTVTFEVVK